MKNYGVGTFAYLDTFAGLVPCKVTAISGEGITIRLTATRGAYKRGEVLTYERGDSIVPRECVYVRDYQYRIRNTYQWV